MIATSDTKPCQNKACRRVIRLKDCVSERQFLLRKFCCRKCAEEGKERVGKLREEFDVAALERATKPWIRHCRYCGAVATAWMSDEVAACEEHEPRLWREIVNVKVGSAT